MTGTTQGIPYAYDGYVVPGYVVTHVSEPIRTYAMFGKTTRVFPFPPNWASPVVETLEWKTDILKSFNGTEQRRALRTRPRRGFEYQMLMHGQTASLFEAYVWGWHNRHWALPVWTDVGKLTSDTIAGQNVLGVDTATLGFRVNDFAILYLTPTIYEVIEIQAMTENSLTAKKNLSANWPAGSRIYPLILAHLKGSVSTARHTSSAMEAGNVTFETSPDNAYDHIPEGAPSTMYDGIEVVMVKPNWKAAISNEFTREFSTVDTGVGPIGYFPTETVSRIVKPFSWLLKKRSDIIEFRKLVGRLRGQAKTCWMPSWHDDFKVAGPNTYDQSVLTIEGTWFQQLVGSDTSRDRLVIHLPDGSTVFRRVLGGSPNYLDGTTQLQLDSSIGTTISRDDNVRVSFLMRCRLASDKVVIPWVTDTVSNPQTTFTTVKL